MLAMPLTLLASVLLIRLSSDALNPWPRRCFLASMSSICGPPGSHMALKRQDSLIEAGRVRSIVCLVAVLRAGALACLAYFAHFLEGRPCCGGVGRVCIVGAQWCLLGSSASITSRTAGWACLHRMICTRLSALACE